MRVLIACECSGRVKTAFRKRGHDAWSCALKQSEIADDKFHIQDDVLKHLDMGWELMIAHPDCTHLAVSGARWFKDRLKEQLLAIEFFMILANAKIAKIAIENPIGIMSTRWRKPDQIIQPWQFGHGETKATCLWLKNLPLLRPSNIVGGRIPRVHFEAPGPNRKTNRSRTLQGIALAMAEQWSNTERRSTGQYQISFDINEAEHRAVVDVKTNLDGKVVIETQELEY